MRSDPVYIVRNNQLYEHYYDYNDNCDCEKLISDDILCVSKYFNKRYYYIGLDGYIYYSNDDQLVVLRKISELPIRIDNVGLPVLVYADKLLVFDEFQNYEITIEDASNVSILYANQHSIFIHDVGYVVIYNYSTTAYQFISAQHFTIYMDDEVKYCIGNVINDKYVVHYGIVNDAELETISTIEYDNSEYTDCEIIQPKYFSNSSQLFVFNHSTSSIDFLFNLFSGSYFSIGNKFYVLRGNEVYMETIAYNEYKMLNVGSVEGIKW
jgi:hypothetical protein